MLDVMVCINCLGGDRTTVDVSGQVQALIKRGVSHSGSRIMSQTPRSVAALRGSAVSRMGDGRPPTRDCQAAVYRPKVADIDGAGGARGKGRTWP